MEIRKMKVYAVTLNQVLKNLAAIQDCPIENLKDEIIEKFDGYDYEDEDEVTGFENWGDISQDGTYKVEVKIDHKDAYLITLHLNVQDSKVTVTNVL